MDLARRHFLRRACAMAAGLGGLRVVTARGTLRIGDTPRPVGGPGYGPLETDPLGVLDLPAGFGYDLLSCVGESMDDGLIVPGLHDGMAAFPGPHGLTILVRNHEIEDAHRTIGPFGEGHRLLGRVDPAMVYDRGRGVSPRRGGTTTVVYDTRTRRVVRHFLSLAGTERNCAGGPTPRNTWISCEETVLRAGEAAEKDHGYCFEVPASAEIGLSRPDPIVPMGRFYHEACATDPRTGIVYMTEDRNDGVLYRYVPVVPDRLLEGGRLQAARVVGRPRVDTRNWDDPDGIAEGETLIIEWIDVEGPESPDDTLRHQAHDDGAARFARAEGMWFGRGRVYFACTTGGAAKLGQIWAYTPDSDGTGSGGGGILELFIESRDATVVENADNITVSPWGDLIVCEDGTGSQYLVGVTPGGEVYPLARNARDGSEMAGATFSPDGSTLFVNIQRMGATLAIRGPWRGG